MKIRTIFVIMIIASLSTVRTMAQKTLADATKGKFLFSVAVSMQQVNGVNPSESELIAKEFSAIVPENCMKPQPTEPEENKFFWDDADKFV
ncbi:MAG TPA: endo-1,4-beta-xylanase, partial [Paludibacter sp.]